MGRDRMRACRAGVDTLEPMPDRTESSVLIPAPPPQVVAVLADFPAYPLWAREVKGTTVLSTEGDGWPDRVGFDLDAGIIRDHYVLDYDWQIGHDGTGAFTWEMVQSRTLRMLRGSYTLTATPNGTLVTYRLTMAPRMPMLGALRRKTEQMIVGTALHALRDRVRQLQSATTERESS